MVTKKKRENDLSLVDRFNYSVENEPGTVAKNYLIGNGPLIGAITGGLLAGPVGLIAGALMGSVPLSYKTKEIINDHTTADFRNNSLTLTANKQEGDKASRTVYMNNKDLSDLGLGDGDLVYVEKRNEGLWNKLIGNEFEYRTFKVESNSFVQEGQMDTSADLEGTLVVSPYDSRRGVSKNISKRKVGISRKEESVVPINFLKNITYRDYKLNDDKRNLQVGDEVIVSVSCMDGRGNKKEHSSIAKVGPRGTRASIYLPDEISNYQIKNVKVFYGSLNELDETGVNKAKGVIGTYCGGSVANSLESVLHMCNPDELDHIASRIHKDGDVAVINEQKKNLEKQVKDLEERLKKANVEIDAYKRVEEEQKKLLGIGWDDLKNIADPAPKTPDVTPSAKPAEPYQNGKDSSYTPDDIDPDDLEEIDSLLDEWLSGPKSKEDKPTKKSKKQTPKKSTPKKTTPKKDTQPESTPKKSTSKKGKKSGATL